MITSIFLYFALGLFILIVGYILITLIIAIVKSIKEDPLHFLLFVVCIILTIAICISIGVLVNHVFNLHL